MPWIKPAPGAWILGLLELTNKVSFEQVWCRAGGVRHRGAVDAGLRNPHGRSQIAIRSFARQHRIAGRLIGRFVWSIVDRSIRPGVCHNASRSIDIATTIALGSIDGVAL